MKTQELTKLEFKLLQFLLKIEEQFLSKPSQKILLNILVSGGQDSMCLLHALQTVLNSKKLKTKSVFTAIVSHFNHKKRGKESDEDAFFVMESSLNLGIECFYFEILQNTKNDNFQNFARQERRRLSMELCKKLSIQNRFDQFFVFTAHHAQDHAESILLHLIRGSGIVGLQGFYAENRSHFLKPFAEIPLDEIKNYAKSQTIVFRTDSSNLNDKYSRNFVRLHILRHFKKINLHYEKNFLRFSKQLKQLADSIETPSSANKGFIFYPSTTPFELYLYFKGQKSDDMTDIYENTFLNIFHEVELLRKSENSSKTILLKNNKKFILYKVNKNVIFASL